MSSAFKTVWFKEIKENLRDKRSMASSIVMGSIFGPLLMLGLMNLIVKMQQDKAEEQMEVPIINIEHANNFQKFLISSDVKILSISKDPAQAIRDQDHDLVLVIDESFSESFNSGKPAKIKLYYDDSAKGVAKVSVNRIKRLVGAYSSGVGKMRLQLRGIPPNLIEAVVIEDHDISTTQSRGAMLLSVLPYFLILGLFMGSMYLAIDTTAGEKERKSLEPLFLNPVSRTHILSGKLAATVSFGLLTLVLTMIAFKLTIPFYPFDELGMSFTLDMTNIFILFLVLFPLALLAGSIQTIIASFSKSFKEAQTYVGLVIIIPMIPSMLLMFMPIKEKLWMMLVPILSQNIIINKLVRGDVVAVIDIVVAVLATLISGLILAWIAVRLYNKETMLFSD
ncbi:MAG: ABC transporter permease [Xanthomonadales bacterium]|nr:ABC transporter permease [Xanthomonadales bacterium]